MRLLRKRHRPASAAGGPYRSLRLCPFTSRTRAITPASFSPTISSGFRSFLHRRFCCEVLHKSMEFEMMLLFVRLNCWLCVNRSCHESMIFQLQMQHWAFGKGKGKQVVILKIHLKCSVISSHTRLCYCFYSCQFLLFSCVTFWFLSTRTFRLFCFSFGHLNVFNLLVFA